MVLIEYARPFFLDSNTLQFQFRTEKRWTTAVRALCGLSVLMCFLLHWQYTGGVLHNIHRQSV